MSAVTVGLLVGGYVTLLVLVICVLTAAKRGDEAAQWPAEPADPAPVREPHYHLGLALADVDAAFARRFERPAQVARRLY